MGAEPVSPETEPREGLRVGVLINWFSVIGCVLTAFAAAYLVVDLWLGAEPENTSELLVKFAICVVVAFIVLSLFSYFSLRLYSRETVRAQKYYTKNALLRGKSNYLDVYKYDIFEVQKTIEFVLTRLDVMQLQTQVLMGEYEERLDAEYDLLKEELKETDDHVVAEKFAPRSEALYLEYDEMTNVKLDNYLDEVVAATLRIFTRLMRRRCAVCIKTLHEVDTTSNKESALETALEYEGGPGLLFVSTNRRDIESHHNRTGANKKYYSALRNSAFKMILDNDEPSNYYLNNDLENDEHYENLNPKWTKFYKSTIVAPIYVPEYSSQEDKLASRIVVGFLCVDSLNAIFDEEVCVSTLQTLAKLASFGFVSPTNKLKWSEIHDQT